MQKSLLKDRLEEEIRNPSLPDTHLNQVLQDYHFVFVDLDGMQNRLLHIFTDAFDEITVNLKAPYVSKTQSNLWEPFDSTSLRLNKAFRDLYSQYQKPLIVFGDPGTGPDILFSILKDPSLVSGGIIHKTVIVQGAMLGCRLIDKILFPFSFTKFLRKILTSFFKRSGFDLTKFATWNARPRFEEAIATLSSEHFLLLKKCFYFTRATTELKKMHGIIRLGALILNITPPLRGGDGFTLAQDEILSDSKGQILGTDLGILEVDHWDLTHSILGDLKELKVQRRAFIRVLLREIFVLPSNR